MGGGGKHCGGTQTARSGVRRAGTCDRMEGGGVFGWLFGDGGGDAASRTTAAGWFASFGAAGSGASGEDAAGQGLFASFVDSFSASLVNGGVPQTPDESTTSEPPAFVPPAKRLIAIGDIHGDYEKAVGAFKVAGLIDERLNWIGGRTVAVQVGDILDRGAGELEVYFLLERLKKQADKAGGKLYVLNGNHEIMNVQGRFRYAAPGGMKQFRRWEQIERFASKLKCGCAQNRELCESKIPELSKSDDEARQRAFGPGGGASVRFLAPNPVALAVGSTLFAHGGLHPNHIDYGMDRMNREASEWIRGEGGKQCPWFLHGRNSVVWSRMYSIPDESMCKCELLQTALDQLPGSQRMVVGHTIQHPFGINGACDDSVFRVDVGMSSGCSDAAPEVLEIIDDRIVKRLRGRLNTQVLVDPAKAAAKYRENAKRVEQEGAQRS